MHALQIGSGSKITKIVIVTALHLGVALALISMKVHAPAAQDEPILVVDFDKPKVVEPVIEKPDLDTKKFVPSTLVAPPPPTILISEPMEPTLVARLVDTTTPVAPGDTPDGTGTKVAPLVAPKPDRVFSAALANASDCALPDYPARSVRNAESGTVTLALLIGTNGKVSEAKVQSSSGFRELDRAALAALSMCKFKPATYNGVAEPAWGQIAYVWSLD